MKEYDNTPQYDPNAQGRYKVSLRITDNSGVGISLPIEIFEGSTPDYLINSYELNYTIRALRAAMNDLQEITRDAYKSLPSPRDPHIQDELLMDQRIYEDWENLFESAYDTIETLDP